MLCDRCKKRQATIAITETINGHENKLYLCNECASEAKGVVLGSTFEEFISGMINEQGKVQQQKIIQCNNCGMTLEEFKKISKMGCANCFSTFYAYINPIVKRIHGSNEHTGKMPMKQLDEIETINEIANYEQSLKEAIAKEEYELAAKLRDKIKALKKGGHSS